MASSDQAVCEIGSAVLPEIERFLDRGLALELPSIEQSGIGVPADQHLFPGTDFPLDQPADSFELRPWSRIRTRTGTLLSSPSSA